MKEWTGSNFNQMKSNIMKSSETENCTPSPLKTMWKPIALGYIGCCAAMFILGVLYGLTKLS